MADGIDPLATLYTQWPWMLIVVAIAKWMAAIGEKMASRHVSFVDNVDRREEDRLGTDKQLAVALAAISEELKDHGGKLSVIKDKPVNCPMAQAMPPFTLQPQGGA